MNRENSRLKKKLGLIALATVGVMTGSTIARRMETPATYPLPLEIRVTESTVPTHERKDREGNTYKVVRTDEIDATQPFDIHTARYRIVQHEDNIVSRGIGHVAAMPVKIILGDWDAGWKPDEKRVQATISMLEADTSIKNLTVRFGHTEAIEDFGRMFTEESVRERNPAVFRYTLGTYSFVKDWLLSELRRGDHYNPYTKTVVAYSNIESVIAHEIGHHKDFERFDTDWVYGLARFLPPVALYQEYRASANGSAMLAPEQGAQVIRYLVPAFLTYVMAYAAMYKRRKKKEEE